MLFFMTARGPEQHSSWSLLRSVSQVGNSRQHSIVSDSSALNLYMREVIPAPTQPNSTLLTHCTPSSLLTATPQLSSPTAPPQLSPLYHLNSLQPPDNSTSTISMSSRLIFLQGIQLASRLCHQRMPYFRASVLVSSSRIPSLFVKLTCNLEKKHVRYEIDPIL